MGNRLNTAAAKNGKPVTSTGTVLEIDDDTATSTGTALMADALLAEFRVRLTAALEGMVVDGHLGGVDTCFVRPDDGPCGPDTGLWWQVWATDAGSPFKLKLEV